MRHRPPGPTLAAALFGAAAACIASAAPDSDVLISKLARPTPTTIGFTEIRFSSLLVDPLVVSGTLVYDARGVLQRSVEAPYRERTTVRDESVRVERDGEAARTFPLRRAPELRGLLTSMAGLLAGDSSSIAEHFDVSAAGGDEDWRLDLTPSDDRLREHLRDIVVTGSGSQAHCFIIRDQRGGADFMLLGDVAARPLPQPLALPALLHHCGAE
jgi:hypothetical protein